MSGQLYEMETGEPVRDADPAGDPCTTQPTTDGPCSIEVAAYDALGFFQDPTGTPPLPAELLIDDCGFYLVSDFPIPGLGFVAVATADASMSDNLVLAAGSMEVTDGSQLDGTPLYAVQSATDQTWMSTAGDPFAGLTSSEVGVFVALDEPPCVPDASCGGEARLLST